MTLDLPHILALLATLTAVPAVVINLFYVYRLGRKEIALSGLFLAITALCAWAGFWYFLIALDSLPETDPPLNIVTLRPTQPLWHIIAICIPILVTAFKQAMALGADMQQIVMEKRACQNELAVISLKLTNREQAIEMREKVITYLTDHLDTVTKQVLELQEGQKK